MEIQINFHETEKFKQFKNIFKEVLSGTLKKLNLSVLTLEAILTTDSYLRKLHKEFFNLDSSTDVITFNLNENPEKIEGEIYVSVERAIDQGKQYKINPALEICRLLIHGCLHLAGYDDLNQKEFKELKKIENKLVKEVFQKYHNKLHVKVN